MAAFDVLLSEIEYFHFQPLAISDTLSEFLTSNIEMLTKMKVIYCRWRLPLDLSPLDSFFNKNTNDNRLRKNLAQNFLLSSHRETAQPYLD